MSDLISRKAAYEAFSNYLHKCFVGEISSQTELSIGEIASVIKSIPVAFDKSTVYSMTERYKIGQILFLPKRGEVLPFKVVGIHIFENRTELDLMYCGNNECYKFLSTHPTTEYVDREYFKTKEKAEKALVN